MVYESKYVKLMKKKIPIKHDSKMIIKYYYNDCDELITFLT